MKVCLLCATRRGLRFLERFVDLAPAAELVVFSFREEPIEPPFLDAIRACTESAGGRFVEGKRVGQGRFAPVWEEPFDLLFAVSWRHLVPPAVYQQARLGAYVFHDSLLPKNRGFSPTVWSMIKGEKRTGVTLIEMVEEVDAGDILAQTAVPIGPDDTIADVREAVTEAYLEVLERSLPDLMAGRARGRPQDHTQATWCPKRRPEDNRIDWSGSTREIYDLVRALTRPYPGAFTDVEGRQMRVWAARPEAVEAGGPPGRVVEATGRGALVATGDGAMRLLEIQLEGDAGTLALTPGQVLG